MIFKATFICRRRVLVYKISTDDITLAKDLAWESFERDARRNSDRLIRYEIDQMKI
jgi:hypothetical protein